MYRFRSGLLNFLYRWLPVFCGCHCRADRSFFYKGVQFPVCARCTGEVIGMLVFLLTFRFYVPSGWVLLVMLLPLIADGTIQKKTAYESTNLRRLLTGLLFGYALFGLIRLFLLSGFHNGVRLGRYLGL